MAMRASETGGAEGDLEWAEVLPRLDAAIAGLAAGEREVILLRFYQQLTQTEVGKRLGISEEAARKRVDRAVGRLRKVLSVEGDGVAFSGLLVTSLVRPAPAHLHSAVTAATLSTPHAMALSKGIQGMVAAAKVKVAAMVVVALLVPVITAGVVVHAMRVERSAVVVAASAPALAAASLPAAVPTYAGSLSGVVVDEQGRAAGNIAIETPDITPAYSARTGADGRFQLRFPESLNYVPALLARTDDRLHQAYLAQRMKEGASSEVRMVLAPAREFPISITDGQHRPVAGATVYVSPQVGGAMTDLAGKAVLRVPEGVALEYILALKDGVGIDYQLFRDASSLHTDSYRFEPDFTGPIAFHFNGVRSVVIHAVDEQGKPLRGAAVYPWYLERPRKGGDVNLSMLLDQFQRFTDASGMATFPYLPVDEVKGTPFWLSLDGYAASDPLIWKPTDAQDAVAAVLKKLIPITGVVHDQQGRPVVDATVNIGGAGVKLQGFNGRPVTKSDGRFTISVDPEKCYVFFATKDHLASNVVTRIVYDRPPAGAIELTLTPGIHVFGTLTVGSDNHPASKVNYLSLVRRDHSYANFTDGQKFAGETVRNEIIPMIGRSAPLDAKGRFEFWTVPGDYYLDTQVGVERVMSDFMLTDETEKEVNLHADSDSATPAALHGRVVLSVTPDAGVPGIYVEGHPTDQTNGGMGQPEGMSDRSGNFEIRATKSSMFLLARTENGSLSGILAVDPDDKNVTVEIAPTATVRGRLVDSDGHPLAGRQLYCTMWASRDFIFFTPNGYVKTGADGAFSIPGLIPRYKYTIDLQDAERENQTSALTTVRPKTSAAIDVGDLPAVGAGR